MWARVMNFFDHYARARAAAEMVRMGRPDLARRLLLNEDA